MAIVPESECRTPTLMVSSAALAVENVARPKTKPAVAVIQLRREIGLVMA
jgi:hypothetical protein